MGYIGNEPTTGHFPVDNFTSSGGSTYTLAKAPASAGAIEVSVQGVLQPTTAYTVSGTTLTMPGVVSGVKIFVRHLGETLSLPTPADGSVTTAKLGVNSVDGTKIAMGSDARGDILYHGATDYARLAKGTSGQVLTMGANDPAWATAAGGGKLKQVVSTALNTIPSSTSTSWVDISGFTVTTATLDASTSKLLIFGQVTVGNNTNYITPVRLKITPSGGSAVYPYIGTGAPDSGTRWNSTIMPARSYSENSEIAGTQSFVYLFQASSTVAHTINLQWIAESGGTAYLNRAHTETYGRGTSSITVQEIGA